MGNRTCLKCNKSIPFSASIDGRRRCLKNRKICLICSPYKEKKKREVFCRKCNEYIPSLVKIKGECKNIGNRKYCLNCSPYGSHNTKKEIDKPGRFGSYSEWCEEVKSNHRKHGKKAREDRKKKLIELSGGCCNKCGYNKCDRALSFHHRNPKEKSFELSKSNLRKPWDSVLAEHKKCDLLCLRCHAELEDAIIKQDNFVYDEWLSIDQRQSHGFPLVR
jgi:hypothetical protein